MADKLAEYFDDDQVCLCVCARASVRSRALGEHLRAHGRCSALLTTAAAMSFDT
jgi:hypothetical protein